MLTVFLVIKKRDSFFYFKPLKPKKLKSTIINLGASFIKLAQVLATRSDFFNEEYLVELKELHDQIPPMQTSDFDDLLKRNFKENPFVLFENIPIASASIGQVHIGYLKETSQKVAIKFRRVGIKEQVFADIKIINFFNILFRPLFSHHTKNSIEAVIVEFSKMIKQEVSFVNELGNLKKFSKVYKSSGVTFPVPFEEYCNDEVIVMSYLDGFRFDDKQSILENKIDFKAIISTLVDFYTTQMLINGYFHADPHPGNLLVSKDGKLILLDFGMVKSVPNETRVAIIELIKSANEKDYEGYISANKRLGTISYEAPTNELAEFSEKMFEIFANENLSSESMQKLAFEVLEGTRDFPFKLPQEAIYILRVSAIIEGLGTTYIENFNGIKDILPILQKNIPKALGANDSLLDTLLSEIKDIPFTIKHFKSTLKQISEGELKVSLSQHQLDFLVKNLKSYTKSTVISLALMLSGLFLLIYEDNFKEIAIFLFAFGIGRILYK